MNAAKAKVAGIAVVALVLATAGCATKKYVQKTISPLEMGLHRVDRKVDQKTAENAGEIRNVDRRAESGISNAQNSADQANKAASTADQHAQGAQQLAQKGVSAADQAQEMVNNIDNYQPTQHETILFGLSKSTLSADDQQRLDQLVQTVKPLKHYAIQIQGFTDKTGSKQYNLQLSQHRAEAVVRYLTLNGNIPLVKIYSLGYGEAAPASPNATRKGRKANRRVEVTVLVPQMPGQQAQAAQSAPNQPNQQ
ncbi:MAG: OmpA family protein [Terriglobia bacterium]